MDTKPTYKELEQRIAKLEAQTLRYKELDLAPIFKGIEKSFPMGITDHNGIMIYVNDPLVKMWGYSSDKEIIGRRLPEFWEGDSIFSTIDDLINTGWSMGEDIGKRKDGSSFNAEYVAIMCKDNNGEPLYMLGQFFDITERKKTEEERNQLINDLQAASKEIKALRGIVPFCSFCKKVRDDKGYWEKVDIYINKYSEADISHSVCPECAKKNYPDMDVYED